MNIIQELIISNILTVVALVAVLEAIKKLIPTKYIELTALILGSVVTILIKGLTPESIINGIVIGLASCKLYDKILDLAFNNLNIEK